MRLPTLVGLGMVLMWLLSAALSLTVTVLVIRALLHYINS